MTDQIDIANEEAARDEMFTADEGNRLIAEFRGWPVEPASGDRLYYNRSLCGSSRNYVTVDKVQNGKMYFKEEMGYDSYSLEYWNGRVFSPHDIHSNTDSPDRPYHSSWDWLMPVIDKVRYDIARIKKTAVIDPQHKKIIEGLLMVDIVVAWNGVISFIEWYNEQTK